MWTFFSILRQTQILLTNKFIVNDSHELHSLLHWKLKENEKKERVVSDSQILFEFDPSLALSLCIFLLHVLQVEWHDRQIDQEQRIIEFFSSSNRVELIEYIRSHHITQILYLPNQVTGMKRKWSAETITA